MGKFQNDLITVIDCVQNKYSMVTGKWKKLYVGPPINLKKSLVRDINLETEPYTNIEKYSQFLSEECSTFAEELRELCSFEITTRVKTRNSIGFKISSYCSEAHANGRIPINKCLNDLFGVRVIFDETLSFTEIYELVRSNYGDKYKCIDSSKNEYKATHIYYKSDNYTFPWELQFWNMCDRNSNLCSHKKYKEKYTDWERQITEVF